jgi:hypothetical protein
MLPPDRHLNSERSIAVCQPANQLVNRLFRCFSIEQVTGSHQLNGPVENAQFN